MNLHSGEFSKIYQSFKISNMYNLIGLQENVKNIYKASYPFIGDLKIEHLQDLRIPYLTFLKNQQPDCPVNFTESIFVFDNSIEEKLKNSYSLGALDDLKQSSLIGEPYSIDEKLLRTRKVASALKTFSELDHDLFALFNIVIHTIFIRGYNKLKGSSGTHGGSSSGAIGVIWLTVNDNVSEFDLVELFIHELTHHLIFIDELNKPQFIYKKIKEKENYAYSSILNMNRPLDKVIHSIIVATELIMSRKKILKFEYPRYVHPETVELELNVEKAYQSVKALKNLDTILHPRGIELMELCNSTLKMSA